MTVALAVLLITVVVFALIGVAFVRGRIASVEDFISARRSSGSGMVALSLIASTLGAWVLFSPAEAAARTGIVALLGYAVGSGLAIAVFAWLGPRMRRLLPEGHAITEFVFHRYGRVMYAFVLFATVAYMFIYLAAELTAIGAAAASITGINPTITVLAVLFATLAYTAYGGLLASLRTDIPQAWIIFALLLFLPAFLAAQAGGVGAIVEMLFTRQPQLVSLGSLPGWETAFALVLAIIGANLFHQGYWQRVWICRNDDEQRRAFWIAGLIAIPAILLAGSFGLIAQAAGVLTQPSAALFDLLARAGAPAVALAALVLAVALVMSSVDTLLSALASLFTVDMARLRPGLSGARLLLLSRWLTLIPALLAGLIALQGYSVLYLFLLADLICVAAAVPTFYGMFEPRLSGTAATIAAVLGLIAGALLFPGPSFATGNLFFSFALAALVPAVICVVLGRRGEIFALESLQRRVGSLDA